jgi:hypothetical protein
MSTNNNHRPMVLTNEELAITFAKATCDVDTKYVSHHLQYESTTFDFCAYPREKYPVLLAGVYRGIITEELLQEYCKQAGALIGTNVQSLFDGSLDDELMRLTLAFMVQVQAVDAACLVDEGAYYLG